MGTQDFFALRIVEGMVLARGGLGGGESGERPRESEPFLDCVYAAHGVRFAGRQREGVQEIEFAFEIQRSGLPARGGEGGGVARVLRIVLAEHGGEDVEADENDEQRRRQQEQHQQGYLSGSSAGGVHSPASSM